MHNPLRLKKYHQPLTLFPTFSQPMIWLSFALLLCQCGYQWGQRTRQLPGGHRRVYMEMFNNQTRILGLESAFTQAMNRELERSAFASLTSKDGAELILKGTIIGASIRGSGSDPNFVAKDFSSKDAKARTSTPFIAPFFTSYTINVTLSLEAIRTRDQKKVWQTSLSGYKAFQTARLKRQGIRSSNVLYNEARKKQTIKLIAQEMMSEAFDRLTENF